MMSTESTAVLRIVCRTATIFVVSAMAHASEAPALKQGDTQFGQPESIELILEIAKRWHETGYAPFNVGDLSFRDKSYFLGHLKSGDHKTGLGIDLRPMRKDGRNAGVRWDTPDYDREATQRLVDMFNESGKVERIVFSDPQLKGTKIYRGLDDHLHVTVKPREK